MDNKEIEKAVACATELLESFQAMVPINPGTTSGVELAFKALLFLKEENERLMKDLESERAVTVSQLKHGQKIESQLGELREAVKDAQEIIEDFMSDHEREEINSECLTDAASSWLSKHATKSNTPEGEVGE